MACSGCGKRKREFIESIQNQNKVINQNNSPQRQLIPPKSDKHTRAMARHLRAIARYERIRLRNKRAKLKADDFSNGLK